jgi:alkanesulfonate monooxygenase
MQVFWFIPTHGDSRYLGTGEGARQVDHDYLKQVAQAADTPGLRRRADPHRPLLRGPVGGRGQPAAGDQAPEVPGGRAPRPAPAQPGRAHGGHLRPALRRPAADQPGHRRRPGRTGRRRRVYLDHAQRYEQSAEFIRIWREILARSHAGQALRLRGQAPVGANGAKLLFPPVQRRIRRCTSAARRRRRTNWRRSRSTPT